GSEREARTNFVGALESFQDCAAIDNQYAELHFRIARCFLGLGKTEEAQKQFALARDLDTLRFRADTRINEIIRAAASDRAESNCAILDAADLFARKSPQKIAGRELLLEHVHLNFRRNYLLARAIAEQL